MTRARISTRHETALDLATTEVPVFAAGQRVGEVRAAFGSRTFAYGDEVFVVGEELELLGAVPVGALLAQPDDAPLRPLILPVEVSVTPALDQELVALAASRHRRAAVPVVDESRRLLGVVPPLAIVDVLQHEHAEDLHRLAGIRYGARNTREALIRSPWLRMRRRLPWLMVGLAGAVVMALAVSAFEAALAAHVAIAFFMPAIVYLADAIGTQTETVVVRGLSHGHLPLRRLLASELATGGLIGAILAALALPLAYWGFGDGALAAAVGLAILVASSVAATIGLVLPWTLSRLRFDPAYGSGPLATAIQDILSVLIYFAIVSVLV